MASVLVQFCPAKGFDRRGPDARNPNIPESKPDILLVLTAQMLYCRHNSSKDPLISLACPEGGLWQYILVTQKRLQLPPFGNQQFDRSTTQTALVEQIQTRQEGGCWQYGRTQLTPRPSCLELLFQIVFCGCSSKADIVGCHKVASD